MARILQSHSEAQNVTVNRQFRQFSLLVHFDQYLIWFHVFWNKFNFNSSLIISAVQIGKFQIKTWLAQASLSYIGCWFHNLTLGWSSLVYTKKKKLYAQFYCGTKEVSQRKLHLQQKQKTKAEKTYLKIPLNLSVWKRRSTKLFRVFTKSTGFD